MNKDQRAVKRQPDDAQKDALLTAAVAIAKDFGYSWVNQNTLAKEVGCSVSLVNRFFGNVQGLRDAVLRYGVENKDLDIICQGLVSKDPYILANVSMQLKRKAALTLCE